MTNDRPEINSPHWPIRLQYLCSQLQKSPGPARREQLCGEAWLLLNTVLLRFIFAHASRLGFLSKEDREDIAADKTLTLLRKCEDGNWDPGGRSPGEINNFLSNVARNGILDLLRQRGRQVDQDLDGIDRWEIDAGFSGNDTRGATSGTIPSPERTVEQIQFVAAVRDCAQRLRGRAFRIWFFRTFFELSSKDIASHPDVQLKPGNVDVILQRSRQVLSECLAARGFRSRDLPPGSFVELWRTFNSTEFGPEEN